MRVSSFIVSSIIVLFGAATFVMARDPLAPATLMIGIGAKNKTFNEAKYPDLQFAYLPDLAPPSHGAAGEATKDVANVFGGWARDTLVGKPGIISEWWDKQDLRAHGLLFDKNGICAWEGEVEDDEVLESDGEGIDDELQAVIGQVFKKGKSGEAIAGKKIDFVNNDAEKALVGIRMPDFDVTLVSGTVKPVNSIIGGGKPLLVIFFQITSDHDLTNIKQRMDAADKADNKSEAWKAKADEEALSKLTSLLTGIEKELFGKKFK